MSSPDFLEDYGALDQMLAGRDPEPVAEDQERSIVGSGTYPLRWTRGSGYTRSTCQSHTRSPNFFARGAVVTRSPSRS
jgi:hypothetical protein